MLSTTIDGRSGSRPVRLGDPEREPDPTSPSAQRTLPATRSAARLSRMRPLDVRGIVTVNALRDDLGDRLRNTIVIMVLSY